MNLVEERPPTQRVQQTSRGRNVRRKIVRRLGELTMIVVGVLVALAVDAWWSGQLDRQLADDYRQRLADELSGNLIIANSALRHTERISAATDSIRSFFEGEGGSLAADRTLVNLYNATRRQVEGFVTSTFDEATSTGNLRLIDDPVLRGELSFLYNRLHRYTRDWYGSEYRAAARRAIPIDVQLRIRSECPPITEDQWSGCPLRVDADWARSELSTMAADSELRGAYRIQAHELAIFVRDLVTVRDDIEEMIERLR